MFRKSLTIPAKVSLVPELGQGGVTRPARDEVRGIKIGMLNTIEIPR